MEQAEARSVSMDPPCRSRNESGVCMVASGLADDLPVIPCRQTCKSCSEQSDPQTYNKATIGIAILELKKSDKYIHEKHGYLVNALMAMRPLSHGGNLLTEGVGSELKKMLSWFASESVDCACESREVIMNAWGPELCRRNMEQILGWLQEGALKHGVPFSRWLARAMVNSAICLVERKQLSSVGHDSHVFEMLKAQEKQAISAKTPL